MLQDVFNSGKYEEIIDYFSNNAPVTQNDYLMLALSHYNLDKRNKAISVLKEMMKKYPNNPDALFNLSIIYYQMKNWNKVKEYAELYFSIDPNSWEINDILSDLYVFEGNFKKALRHIELALKNVPDKLISDLKVKFQLLKEKIQTSIKKTRLAFICIAGGDKFINDIIENLSQDYWVRKFTVKTDKEIYEAINWADIVWFEWADEAAILGTNYPAIIEKKVLVRLHRYEAFTNLIERIKWDVVDKLILVANSMKDVLEIYHKEKFNEIKDKIEVIYNGIKIDNIDYKRRNPGFNIAWVALLNSRKNIVLALQIIDRLVKINKDYKLHIAGKFEELLLELYLKYMVNEMGLENNVIFYGWVDDIDEWLEDKNYLLSTSIHESFGYNIVEAMAKGIKPIIHNFYGAKEFYAEEFIFNTIDEAVEKIVSGNYESIKYRNIVKRYSLDKQLEEIKKILAVLPKKKFDYKKYWEQRYLSGGNSGAGSYGKLAEFKAEIINNLIKENDINTVVEFGCGDGNQLSYMNYTNYIGLDVSQTAIEICKNKFKGDHSKKFLVYSPGQFKLNIRNPDLVVCLDVLYHIIDEDDFVKTLDDIFSLSPKFVVLYTIIEQPNINFPPHMKYRNLADYLNRYGDYAIYKIVKQKYKDLSYCDFVILKKKEELIKVETINDALELVNDFSLPIVVLIDKFDFSNATVSIGKIEMLTNEHFLLEFVLENLCSNLVLTGIVFDIKNNKIIYPEYIWKSERLYEIDSIVKKIIAKEMKNVKNSFIYGFVYNERIMKDIETKELTYNWERGIPGTRFMSFLGFLNVILRYKLVGMFARKTHHILDAGCGFGYGAAYLSGLCDKVDALDIASDSIEFGMKAYNIDNIAWVNGDVTELPYDDQTFDIYVSYETLEHIKLELVEKYINEAYRVLVPNGKFVISTPNRVNRKNINNPFHVKEYDVFEFDNILRKYFKNIDYYSIDGNSLVCGISNTSKVMITIAHKS